MSIGMGIDSTGVLGFGSGLGGPDENPVMDLMLGMGGTPNPKWAKAAGGGGGEGGGSGGEGGGGGAAGNPLLAALDKAAAGSGGGSSFDPYSSLARVAFPTAPPPGDLSSLVFNAPSYVTLPSGQPFGHGGLA